MWQDGRRESATAISEQEEEVLGSTVPKKLAFAMSPLENLR